MAQLSHPAAYSADVKIRFVCVDRTIELAQVSADWIIPESPVELAPCEGEVVLEIDGHPSIRRVFLPDGISLDSVRVRVIPIKA